MAAATPALQLRLDLPPEVSELPPLLHLRLAPAGEDLEDRELELPVVEGKVAPVSLPAAGEWNVCVWAQGFWAACREVAVDPSGGGALMVPVELWRSGRLTGRLVLPEAPAGEAAPESPPRPLPEWLRLGFGSPHRHRVLTGAGRPSPDGRTGTGTAPRGGQPRTLPSGESRCRLERDREVPDVALWACAVPAGRLDLEVRPAGFVPGYHWGVRVPVDGEVDLGTLRLERGASVAGWVEVEDGVVDPKRCTVTLSATMPAGTAVEEAQRLSGATLQTGVDGRGFFQLVGVPPGDWVLRAEQPGRAPAYGVPFEVRPDSETVLRQPVVLRRPLTLRVTVEPAADWMGRSWDVALTPISDFGGRIDNSPRQRRTADEAGEVVFPNRPPGPYVLQVFDSSGQGFHHDRLRLETPLDTEHRVEIPVVTVSGTVRLGDEPLEATLWFGGRNGAFRSELASDEEGRFVGALPRAGRWNVHVEAPEAGVSNRVRVGVEPGASGHADFDVVLPDTTLFGSVVDDVGRPVAEAEVHLQSGVEGARARTDAEGAFEVRAFPPGSVSLLATRRAGGTVLHSDSLLTVVEEEAPNGPVQLVVRPVRKLRGKVQSPVGLPIPGAVVEVATHRPVTTLYRDSARTGADGNFEVDVREGAEALQVLVAAPGHALTVLATPPEEPLLLQPAGEGGELVLEVPGGRGADGLSLLVLQGNLSIPIPSLVRWARSQGVLQHAPDAPLSVPSVAPGSYRLCFTAMAAMTDAVRRTGDWTGALLDCDEGLLIPGGQLLLGRGLVRPDDVERRSLFTAPPALR